MDDLVQERRTPVLNLLNLTIIGSDNGLSPGWHQAINWTNTGIALFGCLGTNFSEILIQVLAFSFKKMRLKVVDCEMAAILSHHQCVKGSRLSLTSPSSTLILQQFGFGCANKESLSFRSLWDVAVILKVDFSNSLYRTLACKIAPRWMPQNITHKISSVNGLVLADPALSWAKIYAIIWRH